MNAIISLFQAPTIENGIKMSQKLMMMKNFSTTIQDPL